MTTLRGSEVKIAQVTTFYVEECSACGVPFGLTLALHEQRVGDKGNFYCPNGHQQHYIGESWNKKITRLQDQLAQREAEVRRVERSRSATQAQLTKERKRIANGVCPCCQRTFVNLQRHIAAQHPEFEVTA